MAAARTRGWGTTQPLVLVRSPRLADVVVTPPSTLTRTLTPWPKQGRCGAACFPSGGGGEVAQHTLTPGSQSPTAGSMRSEMCAPVPATWGRWRALADRTKSHTSAGACYPTQAVNKRKVVKESEAPRCCGACAGGSKHGTRPSQATSRHGCNLQVRPVGLFCRVREQSPRARSGNVEV